MKCRSPPLSRILFPAFTLAGYGGATTIPLALQSLTGSSDLPGGLGRAALITPPYLVLLRAGFCLPSVLPRTRCALTAPFHPYLPSLVATSRPRRASAGGMFSVPLVRQVTLPGSYPAHCPSEFGLSSHLHPFGLRWTRSLRSLPRRGAEVRRSAVVWPTATSSIIAYCLPASSSRTEPEHEPRAWPAEV